jgi:predicted homoserine dehydrogenase-like protein
MTIDWKALEEHFLMGTTGNSFFWFNHFFKGMHFLNSSKKTSQSLIWSYLGKLKQTLIVNVRINLELEYDVFCAFRKICNGVQDHLTFLMLYNIIYYIILYYSPFQIITLYIALDHAQH